MFAASFCVPKGNAEYKQRANNPAWKLVFQDDFSNFPLNEDNWSMYDSPGHAGNGLRSPQAFSVEKGLLLITAKMIDGDIVSGGMAHKFNYTYGKFEFRVRTEKDPSEATSGVVLTWPTSEKWPIDGENDMYETGLGATRIPFKTFIHYGTLATTQYAYVHDADATKWHVIAMEWEEKELRMYRDGELVWTLTDENAIPDVPHHLCIQLDAFKKNMIGVVRMYVDWVKIYQKK